MADTKYQLLKITVDGVAVVTGMAAKIAGESPAVNELYWGVWNFNTSLKIEHKADANTATCRVAYCCA